MLIVIVIVILGIGGKAYMDDKKEQEMINQEVQLIQKKATRYIVENYTGIERIEWLGWSVSVGPKQIHTAMILNEHPSEDFGLFSYSLGNEEHIEEYTDKKLKQFYLNDQDNIIEKNKEGSPNAEITYNWNEDGMNK